MACFVSMFSDLGLGKTKTKRFSEMAQAEKVMALSTIPNFTRKRLTSVL
jgi:hypothetical protein